MTSLLTQILACTLLTSGVFFIVIAAIGVLRFPDMLCRAHAVSKALTMGIALMLLGSMFIFDRTSDIKFLLAIVFQFLTIPVGGHLASHIAYKKRLPRWRGPRGGIR